MLIKTPRKDAIKSQSMWYTHVYLHVFSVILNILHDGLQKKISTFFHLKKFPIWSFKS